MSSDPTHSPEPGRPDPLQEALDATPMLDAPDMWVSGSGRHLSPAQFFALTNEPRYDLEGISGEEVGLVEERCTTVDKKGVERFTQFYDSPLLDPYRTGDKEGPQRSLWIRYDRALAARGVLKEMEFLVRDEHGSVVERIQLYRHGSPMAQLSVDDAIRAGNAHLNSLLKKRSKGEEAYVRLQSNGVDIAQKLIADMEARRRLQKRTPQTPRPAAPITDQDDSEAESALRKTLGEQDAWAGESGPGTVERGDEEASPETSEAVEVNGDFENREEDPPSEDEGSSSLADVLGGSEGFQGS